MLAIDRVRHHGEPVAIVAADDPATARRAAALVAVDYEPLEPLTSVEAALADGAPALHPEGNVAARRADRARRPGARRARSSCAARYEVGIQDQAFLGPESGLAIPDGDGGVELHVATQWLHVDRDQVAAGLGLPRRTACGSSWPASAARSARARTSRSSCTRACSRCAPGGR